jgi:hypothetical protein
MLRSPHVSTNDPYREPGVPAPRARVKSRRCPKCDLVNPGVAQRCDCGYSFVDGTMGAPLELKTSEANRRDAARLRRAGPALVTVGLALLGRLFWVLRRSEINSGDWTVVALVSLLAAMSVTTGLVLWFRKPR